MHRSVRLLLCVLGCWGYAQAQDRVTFVDRSSKTGATLLRSGTIVSEDPGKLVMTINDGRRSDIPVSDVVDVVYDGEPQTELTAARTAERERKMDVALTAYADAARKVTGDKKLLRRHLDFKLAEMRTAQADAGANAGQAIDALRAFAKAHSESRQILACYDALGRLLVAQGQPVQEVSDSLAQLRSKYGTDNKEVANRCDLLRSDLIIQELQQVYARNPAAAKVRSVEMAKGLGELVTISDRANQAELTAKQTFCQAFGDPAASLSAWDAQLKAQADDAHSRAAIHLVRGDFHRLLQNYKEAMWDYLWVDTVYFGDRAQQAKALYYLVDVFDKLGDAAKSRECKDRLQHDNRLRDTRYQKMAR